MILALAGGVGGAKLAAGLAAVLPPEQLTIVVNTGDDFEHLGLAISPDIDTMLYTLGGLADPVRGWGLASETWGFMSALRRLGAPDWFQLGDQDLATHVERTRLFADENLTTITERFAKRFGIACRILPMSNDPVRTIVQTDAEDLSFQDYFVRLRCEPVARGFVFQGAATAQPQPELMALLANPELKAVILCPSNPFVSIGPILALPGVRAALGTTTAPVIAVSPIVGGAAIKGPAAKMMRELGLPLTQAGIANLYQDFLNGLMIDTCDAADAALIEGPVVQVAPTVMHDQADRIALARAALAFADRLTTP